MLLSSTIAQGLDGLDTPQSVFFDYVRLSHNKQQVIRDSIHRVDPNARIVLFGSRVDDQARGGDIDLLVLSDRIGFDDLWPIRRDILDRIGWQKLDLIVENEDQGLSPIARVAMETDKRL